MPALELDIAGEPADSKPSERQLSRNTGSATQAKPRGAPRSPPTRSKMRVFTGKARTGETEIFTDAPGYPGALGKQPGDEQMPTKRGSEIEIGDVIYLGLGDRSGKVVDFKAHPRLADFNPGLTARIAVTDRGSITIIDQQPIRVPE